MGWRAINKDYLVHLADLPPAALEGFKHRRVTLKGRPVIVAPRTLETVQAIRAHGMRTPGAVASYNWPGRYAPRDNQRQTVEFIVDNPRCAVLNGLRTGKTLSAMWAMDYLRKEKEVRRVLIVAPKTILRDVWAREFLFSFPTAAYGLLEGPRAKKQRMAADTSFEYLLINPESLSIVEGHLPDVDMVVVDEATAFKNPTAQRTKALARVAQGLRLVLMTGTPTPQSPEDAYSLCKLLRGGKYMSKHMFRDLTMLRVSQFKWVAKHGAADIVARELQPSVRFKAEDCFDVPDTTFTEFAAPPLSPQQVKLARQFKEEAMADLADKTITAANAAAVFTKLLQVLSGGVYADADGDGVKVAHPVDAPEYFECIEQLVEEAEGPVLIFAPFRVTVALLHLKLEKAGFRVGSVTAGTTSQQRSEIFEKVRQSELDVMIAIPRTVKFGLDLSTSNTIIWAGPPTSYEDYEQANARISGSNQTRKCTIHRVSPSPITDVLYKRLVERQSLQDGVLEIVEKGIDVV